jgi:uncharacterized protein (TIGR02598 family)
MRTSSSSAFSLVEVVIAMGVAAFCLVAMLGLIPTGVQSVKSTTDQTGATTILNEVVTDLRSTSLGSNLSPGLGIALPMAGVANSVNSTNIIFSESGATISNSTSLNGRYLATITLSNSSAYITTALIQVRWPATARTTNSQGNVETITTIIRQ